MFENDQAPGPFAEPVPGADINAIDVDSLLGETESGATPPGSTQGGAPNASESTQGTTTQSQAASTTASTPAAPPAPELEFTVGGKTIKVPLSDPRVKQWTQQGYSYAQQMAAFKAEQEAFQKQQETLKQRYGELEQYVEQNPDWWNHVNQQFERVRAGMAQQTQSQNADPNNPLVQELQTLKQQLQDVIKFKQDSETQRLIQQREQEDRRLNEEIQSIRETYKDLDWNSVGSDGKTMELQVLEFAQQRGIQSFQDAFLLFNHDRLVKLAEQRAKENVVKERQKQTKLGLLGTTQAPKKGITHAEDIKNKSYDDLYREALEELGHAG